MRSEHNRMHEINILVGITNRNMDVPSVCNALTLIEAIHVRVDLRQYPGTAQEKNLSPNPFRHSGHHIA